MINLHVELITGFQQSAENPTGFEKLYMSLLEFANPTIRVNLSEWNDDRKKQVAQLDRICSPDCVFIVGAYSWGVGRGAVQLASRLRRCERYVSRMFTCDGVYHNRLMPWRAMWGPLSDRILGEPVIKMPSNVWQVDMWRQEINKPAGHKIICDVPSRIVDHGVLMRSHESMDEADSIHRAIYECVKQYATAS